MAQSPTPVSSIVPTGSSLGSQKVSLGCGTLILIALIVLIFSGEGVNDLEREVRALRKEVAELRQSVQAQTEEIRKLQAQPAPASGARP